MKKLNNKGFNLVEIIIAILIFAILIIPVISQLTVSHRLNKDARIKQKLTDNAEQVIEYFKASDLSAIDLTEYTLVSDADYVVDEYGFVMAPSGTDYLEYHEGDTITPNQSIANQKVYGKDITDIGYGETYYCKITLDTAEYAIRQLVEEYDTSIADDLKYEDPNDATVMNLKHLDDENDIILTKDIVKYDEQASAALLNMKANQLREDGLDDVYNNLVAGNNVFWGDTIDKYTVITESYDAATNIYTVNVVVNYQSNYLRSADYPFHVSYTLLEQTYEGTGKRPSIYLLYHQYVCNGRIKSDRIVIDDSGLYDSAGNPKDGLTDELDVYVILYDDAGDSYPYNSAIRTSFNSANASCQPDKVNIFTAYHEDSTGTEVPKLQYSTVASGGFMDGSFNFMRMEDDTYNADNSLYRITVELYKKNADGTLEATPSLTLISGKEEE